MPLNPDAQKSSTADWQELDAFIHERQPWMDDVDGYRLPDLPPLNRIPKLGPLRPRWYVLFDWKKLPEGLPENRPWFMGYLGYEDNVSMHAQLMGQRPKLNGKSFLYVCKACGKVFYAHRPPSLMHRPDCGCLEHQYGRTRTAQTKRLEGTQFGWLIAVRYRHGDWEKGEETGWECTCLGADGGCGNTVLVPTLRLKLLQTLACPTCCPEDWERHPGRKPMDSTHYRILCEHRLRLGLPIPTAGRPRTKATAAGA